MTDQCLPSLILFMAPRYVEKNVFKKYELIAYKSNDYFHVSVRDNQLNEQESDGFPSFRGLDEGHQGRFVFGMPKSPGDQV